jgi:hypothetical protein
VHRLVLAAIVLHTTAAAAAELTDELTGPFDTIAEACEALKASTCRPAQDGAPDFTETNECTCRVLDVLDAQHAAVVVLDQVFDDSYRRGGHIVSPLRDYAVMVKRDDGWWLSSKTLFVEMHGGALASNCCESHSGSPWYSFRVVAGRVLLQTGQDIWRTAKTSGGWQPFVEPHAIWSAVMACDTKQCSIVPVAHCTKPSRAIYRLTGDRIETGCSELALASFELPHD